MRVRNLSEWGKFCDTNKLAHEHGLTSLLIGRAEHLNFYYIILFEIPNWQLVSNRPGHDFDGLVRVCRTLYDPKVAFLLVLGRYIYILRFSGTMQLYRIRKRIFVKVLVDIRNPYVL